MIILCKVFPRHPIERNTNDFIIVLTLFEQCYFMSKTTTLTIRIDPLIKRKVEKLYSTFGLNLSDAINMFIHQSLRIGGLPFELKDPFYRGEMSIDGNSFEEKIDGLTIEDLKRITSDMARRSNIDALYLFGSRARGDINPNSDYDFAFKAKEHASLLDIAGLMVDLEELVGNNVDIVDMRVASEHFLKEIEKDGILLYERK